MNNLENINIDNLEKFIDLNNKIRKKSRSIVKQCYIKGCRTRPIHAHSVAEKRLLQKIADKGVLYSLNVNRKFSKSLEMISVGKKIVTTALSFCGKHDQQIFKQIDDENYIVGNKQQEFLFAMRASAQEYTIRNELQNMLKEIYEPVINGDKDKLSKLGVDNVDFDIEYMKGFSTYFKKGTEDLENERSFFSVCQLKKKYWKIISCIVEFDEEYPIVVSSCFKLQRSPSGKLINDLSDLSSTAKPVFLSVFPQEGRTYAILSWKHKDKNYFSELNNIRTFSVPEKKLIISNLVALYTENFAVKPSYWENLSCEVRELFLDIFTNTLMDTDIPFIYNDKLNIFNRSCL